MFWHGSGVHQGSCRLFGWHCHLCAGGWLVVSQLQLLGCSWISGLPCQSRLQAWIGWIKLIFGWCPSRRGKLGDMCLGYHRIVCQWSMWWGGCFPSSVRLSIRILGLCFHGSGGLWACVGRVSCPLLVGSHILHCQCLVGKVEHLMSDSLWRLQLIQCIGQVVLVGWYLFWGGCYKWWFPLLLHQLVWSVRRWQTSSISVGWAICHRQRPIVPTLGLFKQLKTLGQQCKCSSNLHSRGWCHQQSLLLVIQCSSWVRGWWNVLVGIGSQVLWTSVLREGSTWLLQQLHFLVGVQGSRCLGHFGNYWVRCRGWILLSTCSYGGLLVAFQLQLHWHLLVLTGSCMGMGSFSHRQLFGYCWRWQPRFASVGTNHRRLASLVLHQCTCICCILQVGSMSHG
jgi:hypothetical protein